MDTSRFHKFKAGIAVLKSLLIPNSTGDPAGVQNYWLWLDDATGKLSFRISGATQAVPLASELTGGGLTQEQIEDFIALLIQDSSDLDWTYVDGTPALTGIIKTDTVTYAKMQNVSATSRVLGRITAGSGDVEELTGTNIRTILGTLDADTLGGLSAAALQTAVINAISNGAGAAYDTLVEIQALMQADDTLQSGLTTAVGLRARFADIAVPSGSTTADLVHGYTLTNIGAYSCRIYVAATGVEEGYEVAPKAGSTTTTLLCTSEDGVNIPAGRRAFITVGI